jgi:hypothetical protein
MSPLPRTPQQRDRRFARVRRLTRTIFLGSGVLSGVLVGFVASNAKPVVTIPTPATTVTAPTTTTTAPSDDSGGGSVTPTTTPYTPPTTVPVTTTTVCTTTPSGTTTCR